MLSFKDCYEEIVLWLLEALQDAEQAPLSSGFTGSKSNPGTALNAYSLMT
jgi:hypothetical protein